MKQPKITINEMQLMKLYVRAFRYALSRDNHLEPYLTIQELIKTLHQITENRKYWFEFFLQETAFKSGDLKNDYNINCLEHFKVFLIENMPEK